MESPHRMDREFGEPSLNEGACGHRCRSCNYDDPARGDPVEIRGRQSYAGAWLDAKIVHTVRARFLV